ncbi:hypothetical protein ABGV42_01350 [Paenibacillus pabuli]
MGEGTVWEPDNKIIERRQWAMSSVSVAVTKGKFPGGCPIVVGEVGR